MMPSDRVAAIHAATAALVAAIVAAVTPADDAPERLLSVDEAAAALGIGRSRLYSELGGRLRSVKVGRRRLVPASAIAAFIDEADRGTSEPPPAGRIAPANRPGSSAAPPADPGHRGTRGSGS